METFFTNSDSRILRQIELNNVRTADAESFATVVGDDSHLVRTGNEVLGTARPMYEVFEEDSEGAPLAIAA